MFKEVINQSMLSDCFEIRKSVFVEEQGVPLESELDIFENTSTHIIGYYNDHPFACARFRPYEDGIKVERVAILKPYRNKGFGKTLMNTIESIAKRKHHHKLILNAQLQAKPFYEKLGYVSIGLPFQEENIVHIKMYKII